LGLAPSLHEERQLHQQLAIVAAMRLDLEQQVSLAVVPAEQPGSLLAATEVLEQQEAAHHLLVSVAEVELYRYSCHLLHIILQYHCSSQRIDVTFRIRFFIRLQSLLGKYAR
jgi:hypothetical protein